MPSEDSSAAEHPEETMIEHFERCVPGGAEALAKARGELKGSGGSSLGDRCKACGHRRINHHERGGCVVCGIAFNQRQCAAFVPADTETAGGFVPWEETKRKMMEAREDAGGPECTCQTGAWDKFDSPKDCLVHGAVEAQPPRRPPNAVAYELQDGSAFEIALPGDATVRADDGLLIIHHAQSPVKGLVQVKPWGDQ